MQSTCRLVSGADFDEWNSHVSSIAHLCVLTAFKRFLKRFVNLTDHHMHFKGVDYCQHEWCDCQTFHLILISMRFTPKIAKVCKTRKKNLALK